jgi:hypothetical protein
MSSVNTDWSKIKLKDLEKEFNQVFVPENLYGVLAIMYDDALSKSNDYGTTWKEEMQKVGLYLDFISEILEQEGLTPNDFRSN